MFLNAFYYKTIIVHRSAVFQNLVTNMGKGKACIPMLLVLGCLENLTSVLGKLLFKTSYILLATELFGYNYILLIK